MRYCYVQDGRILDGPILLPRTWNNIANFNALDQQSLIAYGWLPHTFIETATEGQIIEGSTFEIFPDKVIETQISRDPTQEELEERISFKWKLVRIVRNYALKMSDWTQVSDSPLSAEHKQVWATYRQQLRDITSTSSNPDEIVLPADPNGKVYNRQNTPPQEFAYMQN
jgi:hypothetical protein